MNCVTNHKKSYRTLNMHFPKVSVIVPIYKAELYLRRCIDSILSQTFKDFELILVDDGSPDKSGEICEEYARKDTRVRVFHKLNGGVSSARNLALDHAIGDFVMFVDSDDWVTDDCLEVCIKEILDNELDALQFGYVMLWSNKSVYKIKKETDIFNGENYIKNKKYNACVWGGIFKKDIIVNNNIRFNESLKLAEDQIFIFSILKNTTRIKYKQVSLYYYFQNPESAVHNSQSKDILLSCENLVKASAEWPVIKEHVDSMVINFILDMIKNNNIPYKLLEKIYKTQDVKMNTNFHGICYIFYKISKINFKMACVLTFIYLKIRLSFIN